MRRIIYFLVFLAVLLLLVSLLPREANEVNEHAGFSPAATVESPPTNTQEEAALRLPSSHSVAEFMTGTERLPASLQGTEVDGGFVLDEEGSLVVTHHIRTLFDYFLSAQGEEELATILQRIRTYIQHQLSGEAVAQADALLDNYIGYLAAAEALDSTVMPGQQLDLDLLSEQKDQLAALRGEHFDVVAKEAFFQAEEEYDRYTIARLKIMQNQRLSGDEKATQLAELRSHQPESVLQALDGVGQYQELRELTSAWQNSNGDNKTLRRIREETIGEEATQRLEQLDVQRAQWQERVSRWQAERERVLSNANLSDEDKQERLEELRADHFNENERLRVRVLEGLSSDTGR